MAARILVVDDSPMMLKLVRDTLERSGYEVLTATSGKEALNLLDRTQVGLIITDVMMPEMDGYALTQLLRHRPDTSRLPILMLTTQDSLEAKVKGFQAGVDDYLTKPFEPTELQMRVQVLLRRARSAAAPVEEIPGKIIAVFSLRGGAGVSTIATNLAMALAQLWGLPAALVDLALVAGQSALMLNLSLHHTWKDLAEKPTEEIDGEMAMQVLLPHASGVHVLASPPLPHQAELVTAEHVKQVLDLLQRRFHYVVLDLPHDFSETTLAGLDTATDILLVLPPDLGSVRATAAALEAFQALGYAEEQIHLVQNWVFKRPGLPRKEMRPFSNAPFAGCCPTWPTPW
ncbi:MAG TPA: response regulator [Anaerolineae bacterium]|nr:response regulator [Anaerolineae bacterium]HID83710.1 response regulator [Anaerolineales bacterium]HIQ09871.1 response regulator [Anaerolineaceae bacterium]